MTFAWRLEQFDEDFDLTAKSVTAHIPKTF